MPAPEASRERYYDSTTDHTKEPNMHMHRNTAEVSASPTAACLRPGPQRRRYQSPPGVQATPARAAQASVAQASHILRAAGWITRVGPSKTTCCRPRPSDPGRRRGAGAHVSHVWPLVRVGLPLPWPGMRSDACPGRTSAGVVPRSGSGDLVVSRDESPSSARDIPRSCGTVARLVCIHSGWGGYEDSAAYRQSQFGKSIPLTK